jgi:hypothetical protein
MKKLLGAAAAAAFVAAGSTKRRDGAPGAMAQGTS